MKKNVKNVLIKLNIEGQGIVNFDSNDQSYIWNKYVKDNSENGIIKSYCKGSNIQFAKKNWYKDENEKLNYKIKISSDCIRHNLYKDEIPFQSPNIGYFKDLLLNFIATPALLTRGYLFTEKENRYKRSTCLNITDAEQVCNAESNIEVFSRSGEKITDEILKDNTFFYKETVGEIKYQAIGNIDLMNLQFLSTDQVFDRFGLNPDYFNIYKTILKRNLPTFNSELGFYCINGSSNIMPEYGIKFSNEDVLYLIKYIFTKLLSFDITHLKSYAKFSSLEYKLVYDPIEDTFNNENGWISIKNRKDIEDINFIVEDFYVEKTYEDSINLRKKINEEVEKIKSEKRAEKKAKAANNKKKKDESNIESENEE